MGPLALLALLVGGVALAIAADDDPDTVAETDPVDDPSPDPDPDTGATFDFDAEADTVTLDLGDDETGSLAVFRYLDTEDGGDSLTSTYEARYYLVPEGTDLTTTWETQSDIPGLSEFDGSTPYEIADMESQLGLELLGTVDLGSEAPGVLSDPETIAAAMPEVIANAPVDLYFVEANTDGDDLVSFLPEGFVYTINGLTPTSVTENTTGSDENEWLVAEADGLTVEGQGGDDRLVTSFADVTFDGGDGDDWLVLHEGGTGLGGAGNDYISSVFAPSGLIVDELQPDNITLGGGAGNDSLRITGGTADGGEGADRLTGYGQNEASLYGGEGNDSISLYGDNMQGFGGQGDDRLSVYRAGGIIYGEAGNDGLSISNGGTGYGGEGNDRLRLDAGGTADGGAGDDLMLIWDFHKDELGTAVMTGGLGEDTLDVKVRGAYGGPADAPYLRVTDFDPDEDVLQIASYDSDIGIEGVELVEADDGSFTDVVLTFEQIANKAQAPAVAVIRLDGVTGLTFEDIVVQMAA